MILKRLAPNLAYLGTALLVLAVAASLQTAKLTQIGFTGVCLGAWLLTILLFGVSVRNSLLFCSLFFITPISISFLCVLGILALSLLLEYQISGKQYLIVPYPLPMLLLFATAVYGLIRARDPGDAYLYFLSTAVVPALLFITMANSRIERRDFDVWIKMIVFIATFLGVVGVILGIMNPEERIGSLWVTAMNINGFYILSLFFAIALGVRAGKSGRRYLWYACAFLIFMGMLYTYTRIALVAAFFGLFLLMLKMKRMRYLGIGVLLMLPLVIPSSMVSRIEMGMTLDFSTFIRLLAWYYSLQQISQHPWFGIGISVWKHWYAGVVPMEFLYAEHSHNIFLKIWLELGVFGFLSYFYIIGAALRFFYRKMVSKSQGNYYRVILIGMVSLLVACLTDIFIQQYSISLAFWISLSFMYILAKKEQTGVTA
jgi:O-antigen ligase